MQKHSTFEHCHIVQNSTAVVEMLSKFNSDPSSLSYVRDFKKKCSRIFKCPFFCIVKHIRLKLGSPSVRPSVIPSEFAILFWTVPGSGLIKCYLGYCVVEHTSKLDSLHGHGSIGRLAQSNLRLNLKWWHIFTSCSFVLYW